MFGKQTKEETDIEIQEALRKKLNLVVNSYVSVMQGRDYHCRFTVTTPRGNLISLDILL